MDIRDRTSEILSTSYNSITLIDFHAVKAVMHACIDLWSVT